MSRLSTQLLDALFAGYRRTLSPVFAASGLGHCRYLPSCSEYAYVAVARHGWLRGSLLAAARVARCHPWSSGGLDPVPPVRAGGTDGRAPANDAHRDHLA